MPQDVAAIRSILSLAPVIPVIILDDISQARPLAEALVAGGLPILEVTLRTPNALRVMEEMAKVTGAIVGSGTVRSALHMKQSVDAGCRFMVSPGISPRILDAADDIGIPLLPGIATPSEAMTAAERGYGFLKFFPAEANGGAPVLKAFASPLPDITFCPTGGIDPAKAKIYLGLPNVICVGGSWIMPADALASNDWARIEALAREASALRGQIMADVPEDGLTHLRITLSETAYIGPGRADLLELIGSTGSISAAGKAMGMSYKRAWSLVQALNAGFGIVLVESSRGGAAQGGAQLTEAGRFVLEHYRAMQDKTRQAIAEDVAALRQKFDMSERK